MALYGTQVMSRPGAAALGYGPGGQVFDPSNPVVMTSGGARPGNAGGVMGNAPASGPFAVTQPRMSPEAAMQQMQLRQQPKPGWMTNAERQIYNAQTNNAVTQGQPGMGQYQSGITAGIVPPSVVQQGFGRMGVSGPGAGTVNTQYDDMMRQGLNQNSLQFGRDAAFDIANLGLAQQRAVADTGLGYGNLLARLFEGNLANNRGQTGLTGDYLMSLLG